MLVPAEGAEGTPRVVPTAMARDLAKEAGLDLVEVAANSEPPVCRIMDFGKFRYAQVKKHKEVKKRSNVQSTQLREVRMMPFIYDNDLESKMSNVRKFLTAGSKVKITIMLRGRVRGRPEVAFDLVKRVVEQLQGLAVVSRDAASEGRMVSVILSPVRGAMATPAEEA